MTTHPTPAPRHSAAAHAVAEVLWDFFDEVRPLERTDIERIVAILIEAEAAPDAALRPRIVCLCGSTRFYDEFQQANYDETMAGRIVLSVGFYPHAKAKHGHGEGVGHDSSEKVALDDLHKRKIDLADEVLVLNVGGYIGESTRSEIDYAVAHGKPVRYLMERCYDPECSDEGHYSGRDLHWRPIALATPPAEEKP